MNTKKCNVCHQELSYFLFYKDKRNKDGFGGICKPCTSIKSKEYVKTHTSEIKSKRKERYLADKEGMKEKSREYYHNNKTKAKAKMKAYRLSHKDEHKLRCAKYYKEHKKEMLGACRVYRIKNKEKLNKTQRLKRKKNIVKIREQEKQGRIRNRDKLKIRKKLDYQKNRKKRDATKDKWIKNNYEKHRAYHRQYWKDRRNNDINFRLQENFRQRINKVIKGESKSLHSAEYLGCSIEEFLNHIKSQWTQDMSWKNYGHYGWHVDHIIPLSNFDFTDIEQQKIALNYKNQQPLWATTKIARKHGDFTREGNINKGNKIL